MDSSVFGLLTDSTNFRFVYLDPLRKLFVSKPHEWMEEKARIIQWIDKILKDSVGRGGPSGQYWAVSLSSVTSRDSARAIV